MLRALVVEDDAVSRMALTRVLRALPDMVVTEAEDGEKAWEMIQSGGAPDLLFLDLNMPRMGGLQLLRMIRQEPNFAAVRVFICSAVRSREIIVEAANLHPDSYLLKPFKKADIVALVQRVREATDVDSPEDVCVKNRLSRTEYLSELETLMSELRSLPQQSMVSMFKHSYVEELLALEQIAAVARKLGATRILELSSRMAQATRDACALPHDVANVTYGKKLQLLSALQREEAILKQQAPRIAAKLNRQVEGRPELEFSSRELAKIILGVFQGGRILAPTPASQSKGLSVPIRATALGKANLRIAGAITERQSFSLSILDDALLDAIENCRKIGDLTRLLSFRVAEKINWASEAAIQLLNREVAAKNEQGIMLLREAVAPDLETFLASKQGTIRESVAQTGSELSEEELQTIMAELRERFQCMLGGQLTAQPVFSPLSVGDLQSGNDEQWAMPFALVHQAAVLARKAFTDPDFDHELKFSTFDRDLYLQAMNVLDDPIMTDRDPDRAAAELKQIKQIKKSEGTYREKCGQLLAMIRRSAGGTGRWKKAPAAQTAPPPPATPSIPLDTLKPAPEPALTSTAAA